jgi:hypothetical protein
MAVKGIGASFKLDSGTSPTTLTDVSTYLDNIQGTSNPERLDGTTFQPDVASPIKVEIRGFDTKGFSLTGKWTAASESFFSAVEGFEGLNYEYGPQGTTSGDTKITGLCNCLSYSGPQSSVAGITTFTVELAVTSREVSTFGA